MEAKLAAALKAGDTEQLLKLFKQVDRNLKLKFVGHERDPDEDTEPPDQSLVHHVVCWSRSARCLKALISQFGTDCLAVRNDFGDTPVHCAARHQKDSWLQLIRYNLFNADCFGQPGSSEQTPVHSAAQNTKDNSALKWLVRQCGRDCLTAADQFGNTPVHLAAWKQGVDSMELMERNLGTSCFLQRGQFERTAVHWAAMNRTGNAALRWLADELGSDCLREPSGFGNTPVHLAAWKQGAESMELMKNKLGPECFSWRGQCGRSVIHKAALNTASNSALKWLVEELGTDRLAEKDDQGNSVLHLAAWKQDEDSMKFIAEKIGTEAFRGRGNFGWTVAHMAAQNRGSISALAWCVSELGADCLRDKDSRGRTPAHLAARHMQGLASLDLIKDCLGVTAFDELKDNDGRNVADFAENADDGAWKLHWIAKQRRLWSGSDYC